MKSNFSVENVDLVAVISSQNKMVMIKDRISLKCLYIDDEGLVKLGNIDQCEVWEIVDNKIKIKTNNREITFGIFYFNSY